jgi:glycosyltransferase involved in cell wall biosynthesis
MIDISIIIPCYNHGVYLKETLQSIKDCGPVTYAYEIIIVNDGSTDKLTLEILQEIEKEGYFIYHQQNQGLGAARNNAIQLAKGRYILPLDSDNKICRPYLTTAIDILEREPAISIVYGDAEYFGEKTGRWVVGNYNLQKLMYGNYIDACTVIRKDAWVKTGGYDEKMPVMGVEDWDFWLRLSFSGFKFYYMEEICFYYRVSSDSMINSISFEKWILLDTYFQNKYRSYLNRDYLNEIILKTFKQNKKLIIKLFLAIFYPRILNRLFESGKIKSKNII